MNAPAALSAPRPIEDSPRPPLAVEMLVGDYHRRLVTVQEQQAFRESIANRPAFDEIDYAMAVDAPPQRRSEREISRVLGILDSLERSGE